MDPDNSIDLKFQMLNEKNRRLQRQISLLSSLGSQISADVHNPSLLQDIVSSACELTSASYGVLAVFGYEGYSDQIVSYGVTLENGDLLSAIPGWLRELKAPLRVADLSSDSRFQGFPTDHATTRSFLAIPVRQAEYVTGVIYAADKTDAQGFTPEDEGLLSLLASYVSLTINTVDLNQQVDEHFAQIEQDTKEMEAVSTLTRLATSTLELDEILERTLPVMLEGTGADAAEIWILNAETGMLELKAQQGEPREPFFERQTYNIGEGFPGIAASSLQPIVSYDLLNDPDVLRKQIADAGFSVLSAFPLILQDSPTGVLCVAFRNPDHTMTDDQDRLLRKMADQLAIAVQNAQLFAQVEELAEERLNLLDVAELENTRLEALIETSPIGILVAEAPDGRVSLINREAQRILGLVGNPPNYLEPYSQVKAYYYPDGSAYTTGELPMQRALFEGESVRAEEILIERADGQSILTLISSSPVYSPSEEITGAIACIQDISALQEVEKLRNEFLGMVSHEFKTPLTSIKGSAATVLGSQKDFDADEVRELFEIIDEQADRLRELVDNLLDMSRIESGSFSVKPEPVDLKDVIQQASLNFSRSSSAQDVQVKLPDSLPRVNADRRRVIQVLNNLLNNASRFSPPVSPIEIAVEQDPVYCTIHVTDRGRGVPREQMPDLFKKFSRLHEENGHDLSGAGLGLAICKGIVEAHGGRIWAHSAGEGKGTTFSFTLPVIVAIAPDIDGGIYTRERQIVRNSDEKKRILAIDNDQQVLRYLRRTLDEAGFQTIATTSPSQISELVESEDPDLVILDLVLPGTSGFELLRRIRSFSDLPVIFLTGSDRNEDAVRALNMGADDYITKPFSPTELVARIEAVFRRKLITNRTIDKQQFVLNDLSIDFAERRVTVAGREISLSATEYKLLSELATNAGRVLTYDQLLQRVWGQEYAGETDLVRSFIRNLRRKLNDDSQHPSYVFTERQVGYRMPRRPV
jgi:DNA-binding response OmpR family regulator/signal transduction histidine kinase